MNNERQKQFEERAHQEGIRRLKKQINTAMSKCYFSSADGARHLTTNLTLDFSKDLKDYLEKITQGRAVTRADTAMARKLVKWMDFASYEGVAVILLKSIFDIHGGGFENPTSARVGKLIGERLEDELRFRFYEITAPKEVVEAAWRRVTEAHSSPHYRRLSTKMITEKLLDDLQPDGERWRKWTSGYTISMGLLLIEFALIKGLCFKENNRKGTKTTGYIKLAPEFVARVDQFHSSMEDVAYFRKPLIEKPLPWLSQPGPSAKNCSGGYHTDKLRYTMPMCRGYAHRTQFGDLSIQFLNLLGETAYSVDTAVLEVAEQLAEKNHFVDSFLPYQRTPQLDEGMPPDIVALPTDHPDRINWRRERKELHMLHQELVQKSVRTHRSIEAAREFLDYPRFYLSWSYDYRGRAYPQQPWLQPQSTEFEKSLIRFADGCQLDERGLWWVHHAIGAAYLGTRLNLDERVQWSMDNLELVKAVGSDPLSTISQWEGAKEPFQFLQLCMEFYRVVIAKTQHLWYVPVGADATSSGLQLLSACLRDNKGMKHSNVLKPETDTAPPEDAYMHVLEKARELAHGTDNADLIPFLIHRNLGKTTMKMLYGATTQTVRLSVQQVFRDLGQLNTEVSFEQCSRMAVLLQDASAEVFPAAFAALKWLKKLAKLAADKSPDEFRWSTPSGDRINCKIFKVDTHDVRLSHLGKVRIPLDTSHEQDYKRLCGAFPPGYVHSLDAALLKLSFHEWHRPVTSIHDCFKVLPKDMDRALEAIRRAFYCVCSGDPLAKLADDMGVSEEELERIPQGSGDLQDVFNSTYLFN